MGGLRNPQLLSFPSLLPAQPGADLQGGPYGPWHTLRNGPGPCKKVFNLLPSLLLSPSAGQNPLTSPLFGPTPPGHPAAVTSRMAASTPHPRRRPPFARRLAAATGEPATQRPLPLPAGWTCGLHCCTSAPIGRSHPAIHPFPPRSLGLSKDRVPNFQGMQIANPSCML